MTDIADKWFNGVNLGAYGLVTGGLKGPHDSAGEEVARTWIAGRDVPSDVAIRRELVPVRIKCTLAKDTHEELVKTLDDLRAFMSPRLGFVPLMVPDRPGERTFAKSKGFAVNIDSLPYYQTVVEWDWALERFPWWEDETERTVPIAGASGTITNTGTLPAIPVYTCSVGATLSSGLSFTVDGVTFDYDGALVNTDVLVVYTDLPDVYKNGTRDFANVNAAAEFPTLAVGDNAVTKSSTSFTLSTAFRRRKD